MLVVGESRLFDGEYIAHWEVSRFELAAPRRWWFRRVECCELETRAGLATLGDVLFGAEPLPENWRESGRRFAMSFAGTVLERGHFGHIGWCRWRVRVEEWHSVAELIDSSIPAARLLR
jgi:hypothetical protein